MWSKSKPTCTSVYRWWSYPLRDYKLNQIFWTSEPGQIMDDINFWRKPGISFYNSLCRKMVVSFCAVFLKLSQHLSKMFLIGSVSEIWENVSKIFCSFWRSAFAPAKAKDEWRWNFNLPENQNGFHNDEILSFANEGGGLSLGNHGANENHSWTAQTCFALTLVSHWIVRPGPSNRFWSS